MIIFSYLAPNYLIMRSLRPFILSVFLMAAALFNSLRAAEPLRIAVAGVTHDHIWGVVSQLGQGTIQVVGVWEADGRYLHDNALTGRLPKDIFYADIARMLDETRPEAVVAYGSIKEHLAVVEACAPRGIHVMVEKPLATTMEDALRMAAIAREHGIHLLTNYETTWYASNLYVKQKVEEGTIGPIYRIEVYDGHPGPIEIGCSKKFTDWLADPAFNGGGAVMDFGCYGANLATWLLGGAKPLSVYAVLQQNKPDVYPKVDDDATIVLNYPGTTVQINASWCWPYHRKDMYVYGKDGLLYQATPDAVADAAGKEPQTVAPLPEAISNPFRYLAAVVRGQVSVSPGDLSSLENNLVVMEILTAALRSAQTSQSIPLR